MQFRIPSGDTVVCRCEEVTAQQISNTVKLGCTGPNQMKSFLRCGMGPCQGRICGAAAEFLLGWGMESVRPPVFPTRLESLIPSRQGR